MVSSTAFQGEPSDERALVRRYELILDSLAEGVLVLDRQGRLAYANPAALAMLGYAHEELLGVQRSMHDLLHHARADGSPYPLEECPMHAAIVDGAPVRVAANDGEVLWRKDGTCFPVTYVSAPIVEEGEVVGAAVAFTDVTRRLQRQDERAALHRDAAESEKLAAMGTLVSGLSHEVKTPLTILQNNVALARFQMERATAQAPEVARVWETMRERFDEMEDAVARMTAMVSELRRFSRLDETEVAPVSLEDVVADAARLFKLAFRSSIEVGLELDETRPVLVDPLKVQQLLMNLLENGAHAAVGRGGRVRVATRMSDDGGRALLVVEDDGPGMPPEVQARMYDPLFTTREDGTGLGLAVVKRIADEHRASIDCDSAPGKGTRFTVAFPCASYE